MLPALRRNSSAISLMDPVEHELILIMDSADEGQSIGRRQEVKPWLSYYAVLGNLNRVAVVDTTAVLASTALSILCVSSREHCSCIHNDYPI